MMIPKKENLPAVILEFKVRRAKEKNLEDIAALQTFDKEVLSKVIDKVYVYGPDRVEIIWKADDIFFREELPEKRKVINPAEMSNEG